MTTKTRLPWQQYQAYREVIAHPDGFQDQRFTLAKLKKAAKDAEVLFRGWPFIYFPNNVEAVEIHNDSIAVEADLSDHRSGVYFERWELHQSGLFFHRALMEEETRPDAQPYGKVINFLSTVYHVSEAVGSLWRLFAALGIRDDEFVTIRFRYTDMNDRRFIGLDPRRPGSGRPRQASADAVVERKRRLPLGSWRGSDADIARDLAGEILERAGWDAPNVEEINRITHEFLAKPAF
jgi:hypothetical protein